jgi:hypothetical protein
MIFQKSYDLRVQEQLTSSPKAWSWPRAGRDRSTGAIGRIPTDTAAAG